MSPKFVTMSSSGALLCAALAGGQLASPLHATSAAPVDVAAGSATFKQRCMMCHTITPGAKGTAAPNLNGIGGRIAGTTPYAYSTALKASKIKWSAATLDQFLAAPSKMVPGTRMIVAIPDAKKRAEVANYLVTLRN